MWAQGREREKDASYLSAVACNERWRDEKEAPNMSFSFRRMLKEGRIFNVENTEVIYMIYA